MKLINGRGAFFLVIAASFAVGMVACDPGSSTGDTTGGESSSSGSGSGSSSGNSSGSSSSGGSELKLTSIDDMEDMNGSILSMGGAWYTYNDETMGATQTPVGMPFVMAKVPKANGTSQYAANSTGSGFTTWGAGFGFDLNNDGVTKKGFDGSQYTGITFWALAGTGGTTNIRFNVGDSQTTPEAGNCAAGMCSDDFGANVTLSADWQQFTFRFADMKAVNWSKANLTAIDKAGLYYVHFQASQNTTFDIWIDDIAFFTE
jgi:hypothetical protein